MTRRQGFLTTLTVLNFILIVALILGFFWLRQRDSQRLAVLEDQLAYIETELQAIDNRYLGQLERLLTEGLPTQLGQGFDNLRLRRRG